MTHSRIKNHKMKVVDRKNEAEHEKVHVKMIVDAKVAHPDYPDMDSYMKPIRRFLASMR